MKQSVLVVSVIILNFSVSLSARTRPICYSDTGIGMDAFNGDLSVITKLESGKTSFSEEDWQCLADDALNGAVAGDHYEIAVKLISMGADVNYREYFSGFSLFIHAMFGSDFESKKKMMDLLVAKGFKIKETVWSSYQRNALQYLLMNIVYNEGDELTARKTELLLSYGIDVNTQNEYKETVLMEAAAKGYALTVKTLLAHSANPNLLSLKNTNALIRAAANGKLECVEILLDSKYHIDINQQRTDGLTALDLAELYHKQCQHMNCGNRQFKEVIDLLLKHGASHGTHYKEDDSMVFASESDYEELSLKRGASLKEVKNAYRQLALKWHPDKNPEADAPQKYIRIREAFEHISKELQYSKKITKSEKQKNEKQSDKEQTLHISN